MKKAFCCIGCLIALVLLCACSGVAYVGYIGFMPGVSSLFGSNKPRDLGVISSPADFDSYMDKTGTRVETMPAAATPRESIVFSEIKDYSGVGLTEAEVTARVNGIQWAYTPVKNTQIAFNADGTIEMSGVLVLDNIVPFLSATGFAVTQEQLNKAIGSIGLIPIDPIFYIKAYPVVSENAATVSIQELEIGKMKIDVGKYGGDAVMSGLVNQIFTDVDGFYARSVTVGDGTLTFDGTAPALATVLPRLEETGK